MYSHMYYIYITSGLGFELLPGARLPRGDPGDDQHGVCYQSTHDQAVRGVWGASRPSGDPNASRGSPGFQ